MSEISLLTGQLLATNPQFAQAYRQLIDPTLQSGDAVAGRLGINASLGDIESLFKDAVDKGYSASKQEYENTLNDYYRTILNNVGNITQLLRDNNAEAANTGASRGVVAANELSALLGAASEANQNASKLADQGITIGKQYGADIATALKDANTTYNDLRLQLGNLANADYLGQVQQYAAELAYLQQLGLTGGYGSSGGSGSGNYTKEDKAPINITPEGAVGVGYYPGDDAVNSALNPGVLSSLFSGSKSGWTDLGSNKEPFLPDGTVNPNTLPSGGGILEKLGSLFSTNKAPVIQDELTRKDRYQGLPPIEKIPSMANPTNKNQSTAERLAEVETQKAMAQAQEDSFMSKLLGVFQKDDDKTKRKTYDYAKTGAVQTAAQNKAAADSRAKAAAAEKARAAEAQAAAKKRAADAEAQRQRVAAEKARVAAAQEAARARAAAQAKAAADAARAKAAAAAKAAADKARAGAAAKAQAQASAAAVGVSSGGQNITYNGGGQAQGVTGTANLQNQNPYINKPATTKPKKTYAQMMAERDAEARKQAAKKK